MPNVKYTSKRKWKARDKHLKEKIRVCSSLLFAKKNRSSLIIIVIFYIHTHNIEEVEHETYP